MRKVYLTVITALFSITSLAYGHGVNYGIFEEHTIAIYFGYAGGEPMSYAQAKVFGPESSPDLEFQNGRTDARGVFAFVPDRPGTWQVEASDNLGHKGRIEVVVEQDQTGLKAGSQTEEVKNESTLLKVLLALSAIANLAFLTAFIKRPRKA
jgi:nickel transport protein